MSLDWPAAIVAVKFSVQRSLSSGTAHASGLEGPALDSRPPLLYDEPAATYERVQDERGRHQPARTRRQGAPDPRPLRPDRQPLRLVCLYARPRRAGLADRRPLRGILTFVAGHQPPQGEPTWGGSEPIDQSRPRVVTP
jgi:hypothetical protein